MRRPQLAVFLLSSSISLLSKVELCLLLGWFPPKAACLVSLSNITSSRVARCFGLNTSDEKHGCGLDPALVEWRQRVPTPPPSSAGAIFSGTSEFSVCGQVGWPGGVLHTSAVVLCNSCSRTPSVSYSALQFYEAASVPAVTCFNSLQLLQFVTRPKILIQAQCKTEIKEPSVPNERGLWVWSFKQGLFNVLVPVFVTQLFCMLSSTLGRKTFPEPCFWENWRG